MEGSRYDHPYYGRPGSVVQQEQLFSADFKRKRGIASGLAIIAIQIGVPLIAACLARSGSSPNRNMIIYAAGLLIAAGAHFVFFKPLPVRGCSRLYGQFVARRVAPRVVHEPSGGIWGGVLPR